MSCSTGFGSRALCTELSTQPILICVLSPLLAVLITLSKTLRIIILSLSPKLSGSVSIHLLHMSRSALIFNEGAQATCKWSLVNKKIVRKSLSFSYPVNISSSSVIFIILILNTPLPFKYWLVNYYTIAPFAVLCGI